jgi:3-methylcrotonyl-CoA carboxylase alpha subunit
MKMETVIRSPQDGIIKKLAHKAGVSESLFLLYSVAYMLTDFQDICKAGTILVQFEESEKEDS